VTDTRIQMTYPQRERIRITLRLLEQSLLSVERAINEAPVSTRLTRYTNFVSPAVGASASALGRDVLTEIGSISSDLVFEAEDESVVGALLGNLHIRISDAVELRPRFLRGTGEVSESLADYIEPKAVKIEALMRRIISLLESERQADRIVRTSEGEDLDSES
jgi:hypothetical protein